MTTNCSTDHSLILRWGIGLTLLAAIHWVGLSVIHEPSELIWILIPIDFLILALWLRVIPLPSLNAQLRAQLIPMGIILVLAPIAIYGTLVYLCASPFSIWECLIAEYVFVFCLEIPLLYLTSYSELTIAYLHKRVSPRTAPAVTVLLKSVMYLMLIPVLLATLAIHRPKLMPVPFQFLPASQIESVEFPSRSQPSLTLRGVFLKHPQNRGTVIICHGVGANRSDISAIVDEVYTCGMNVLSFDFRGHGESDGHTITYGFREREDVLGAYDYCLSRPDVASDRLFALGVSMGASSLLLALPEMPRIQSALLDSPYANLNDMVLHQFRWFPEFLRVLLASITRAWAYIETGADIAAILPEEAAQQVQCPVTLIHGQADFIVPVTQSLKLQSAFPDLLYMHTPANIGHIGTITATPHRYRELIQATFLRQPLPGERGNGGISRSKSLESRLTSSQ